MYANEGTCIVFHFNTRTVYSSTDLKGWYVTASLAMLAMPQIFVVICGWTRLYREPFSWQNGTYGAV